MLHLYLNGRLYSDVLTARMIRTCPTGKRDGITHVLRIALSLGYDLTGTYYELI